MPAQPLRFRQVHLDFHTSEHIPDVAAAFDPDCFAETLANAAVDSITCFARCHHGWLYYPSEQFAERIHPHLKRPDLLGEQIAACHKRDIRVPIYITVQWDDFTGREHPEWLCLDPEGKYLAEGEHGYSAFQPGFYRFFCLNTPYRDFLKAQTAEVLDRYDPVDGLFFDIVKPQPCACPWCRQDMQARGIDPADPVTRMAFGREVIKDFMHDMSDFVRQRNDQATIFYNSSHVSPKTRPWADAYSHFELESLPSGGWGYMHFPLTVRYARKLGKDVLGMTGKFHTSWGDFQSFKNPAALEFECFQMLAMGARCSIGDQLHPAGTICQQTYELIGQVYRSVQDKEPWCRDAHPVCDVALLSCEEFTASAHNALPPTAVGATRMLQEIGVQFDILDSQMSLERYRALILPDEIPVDAELNSKIQAFVESGGAVLATGKSGLSPDGAGFGLSCIPAEWAGPAEFEPDFLRPGPELARGLRTADYVMYQTALAIRPAENAEILAETVAPYFNRTWEHFCSHRHAPSRGEVIGPAAVGRGRVVYLTHPVFQTYAACAPVWCKLLVRNALDYILPDPLLRVAGASSIVATVTEQPAHSRRIVHLLHYIPERRGQAFDVIEDVLPVRDVELSLRCAQAPAGVQQVPEARALDFEMVDGRAEIHLPELRGHAMIEVFAPQAS